MFSYIWHNKKADSIEDFRSQFEVTHVLPLLWIEHCVECAAPLCYSSCRIFKPRSDGRCLRFENGVVPYDFGNGIVGGQIEFRRWAKIQANLSENLIGIPVIRNNRIQNRINKVGLFLEKLFENVAWHKHRPSKVVESLGLIYTQKHIFKGDVKALDGFLATIYNHQDKEQKFIFEIEHKDRIYYKNQILLEPGWNEKFIPISDMKIDCLKSPHVRLYLDNNDTGKFTFMYFDFVSTSVPEALKISPADKVKCVAWDLDNTIWKGVIGDDGAEGVSVRQDVIKIIKQLDKMGILQTIVSKNTFDIAWKKIEEIGIGDYFLYPAINWGQKSKNLTAIAKELNINIDTFALIDDSKFERHEVKTALPQVRVYDVSIINKLLKLPEFNVPITDESEKRRLSYMSEKNRKTELSAYNEDYDSFLKDCRMKLQIFRPQTIAEKERCFELLQRSHQYNISNKKKTEEAYQELYENKDYLVYAMRVKDKYGDYGIVGFASLRVVGKKYELADFVMSCRVAQKKVERAFFKWLVNMIDENSELDVEIIKTDRNTPIRYELKKMPFKIASETEEKVFFVYIKKNNVFINDDIIEIDEP